MSGAPESERESAQAAVRMLREGGDEEALAEGLESFATAAMEEGDLGASAAALEEAAGRWESLGDHARQGHALLLAAASRRLAQDFGAAAHDLARADSVPDLPDPVRRALDAERAEQDLAAGRPELAAPRFTAVLDALPADEEPLTRAHILQRRAAAAVDAGRWRDAAADLMDAEALYAAHGTRDEAEAAALGAAAAISNVDVTLAEDVLGAIEAHTPEDGAAAARRGVVGGHIAKAGNRPDVALGRFDAARQAALDVADPIAYLTAAAESSRVAEQIPDDAIAYGRLATAWATLGDLLGEDAARQLVRPLLVDLRDRMGVERFAAAREAYEKSEPTA